MIITQDYIIGHLPKTGGHALAYMMHKAGINFECPFEFNEKQSISIPTENKHKLFSELTKEEIGNKSLYLVIRKLPSWLLSYTIHQAKHYNINYKGNLEKTGILKTYSKEFKKKQIQILPPDFICYSILPDYILEQFLGSFSASIKFLRMEYLQKDFEKEFNIKLPSISNFHSYNTANYQKYWNKTTTKILRNNNPIWSDLQSKLYET